MPSMSTNYQISLISEIDEDIIRGQDRDGAGDDVEHGLYLEQDVTSVLKLSIIRSHQTYLCPHVCLVSEGDTEDGDPSTDHHDCAHHYPDT